MTPNHHYFQGHYAKMYNKQLKQLEQQKVQNALIVRNIKTLSKLSESNEMSVIKKAGESNTIGGENELFDG